MTIEESDSDRGPRISNEVAAGQAVYSKSLLDVYDLLVLGISNRFIWKCPTSQVVDLYDEYISENHLEVGVGTGYFLDHCRMPSERPRLVLMDLNTNCLEATATRVARYKPTTLRANVLERIPFDGARFDSIGINYVLHCLPGSLREKSVVFDHLIRLLNPGGVIFGSTLLAEGVSRGWFARRLMAAYNRKGIFSNENDSLVELERALEERFSEWVIDVAGCGAIFAGRIADTLPGAEW